MTAGWVAGGVRGRLLTLRRLGLGGAREVAAAGALAPAVALVARSAYGRDVRVGDALEDARRGVGAACLWHLRVLAGWLPASGGETARVFASRFEIDNIVERLASSAGVGTPAPYDLGALAVAWPRVRAASTVEDARAVLGRSAWGDPGDVGAAVPAALEARWYGWVAATPGGAAWGAGGTALLVARLLAAGRRPPPPALPDIRRQLGRGWEDAADVADLTGRLPGHAVWALDGVRGAGDLWWATGRWWARVDRDAAAVVGHARPGPETATAVAARLLVDAWRVQSALEAAARGPAGLEAWNVLA